MNHHYARAVREAMMDLILGRCDHIVKIGDIVEMLLSTSFAVKDAMLDWEWLGVDEQEWPPQRLDWEMYRIEHLAFASNMEASFDGWLQQPWHILYSALRCMACQEWKMYCQSSRRRSIDWARKVTTPSVATLLAELYPNKSAKDCLPTLTIIYMAPGGHRQWPMSISALLERLSWLVLQTRPLALSSFQTAVQKNPKWRPRYRCGPQVAVVPPPPTKFLHIGTNGLLQNWGSPSPKRRYR